MMSVVLGLKRVISPLSTKLHTKSILVGRQSGQNMNASCMPYCVLKTPYGLAKLFRQTPVFVLMIWSEPKCFLSYYFCLTNALGLTKRSALRYSTRICQPGRLLLPRPPEMRSVGDEIHSDVKSFFDDEKSVG
jgi:hypothetical protein